MSAVYTKRSWVEEMDDPQEGILQHYVLSFQDIMQ